LLIKITKIIGLRILYNRGVKMINRILWLDDNFEPISFLIYQIKTICLEKKIKLDLVTNPNELIDKVINYQIEGINDYLLILDLFLIGIKEIIIPSELYKPKPDNYLRFSISNRDESEIGLLLYEKLFIDSYCKDKKVYLPVLEPPPLMILTVSSLNNTNYETRFEHIIQITKERKGTRYYEGHTSWVNKFDLNIRSLIRAIEV
jgi:hypothetical protein